MFTAVTDKFIIHDSIAEHYAAMGKSAGEEIEFAVHRLEALQRQTPYTSPLFRANFYSVVLITQGSGFYIIDSNTYPIRPRSLFFTNPGHIKGYGMEELVSGYIVSFSESFLKQYVHENILDECSFLIAEVVSPYRATPELFRILESMTQTMLEEFEEGTSLRSKIIGSLLMVVLLKIKEAFWKHYSPLTETDGDTEIVRCFKRNLESHYRALAAGSAHQLYQVQDYAAAQHLHPNYFGTVIKRKTGKTVTSWITEKTISEAKAQLVRSHASIQQIASNIGFKDAAHFSRFFKKQTGQSPTSFRTRIRDR